MECEIVQSVLKLNEEYERIWAKVLAGENFALIRNGDGERGLIEGRSLHAQEGWESPEEITQLGVALKESISIDDPQYIIGVSCPCCDLEAYQWYVENVKSKNITFANLWVNSNYQRFIQDFSELDRDAVVIANHRAMGRPVGKLHILDYFCVSDDCVAFWRDEGEAFIQNIMDKYGDRQNLLFAVSVGPMSGPIIAKLFRNNPQNCYLDFGSAIDSFYWEKVTRPYMNQETVYAKQMCWMFHPQTEQLEKQIATYEKEKRREEKRRKSKRRMHALRILPQRCARKIFGDKAIEKMKKKIKG